MPYYTYANPHSGETKEVFQHMEDEHTYAENGVKWERVFEVPQSNIDALSNIDPFSKQQFMDRTNKTRGITQGDLWDISADLSNKRAKKAGKDPVKETHKAAYKKRTGLDLP